MMWPFNPPQVAALPKLDPPNEPTHIVELFASDTLLVRAERLAEIAFGDFANPNRMGMRDRAAFRLAKALELYEKLDSNAQTEATT